MSPDRRRPAGTPSGGQFAATPHPESDATLADPQATKVAQARAAYMAAVETLAQAHAELVERRVRDRWPSAEALAMHLGPDDDWGVVGVVDGAGEEIADWQEAALRDEADIAVSVFEMNDLGRLAPLIHLDDPDDTEGLWRLPDRSATHD